MMPLIAIVTLVGAALGLRLKVFVLVPATILSILAILGFGFAHNNSFWSAPQTAAFVITALQVGYLIGSTVAARSKLSLGRKLSSARHGPIS